ncbi:MAG: class I SAM-dependent methyltransferase [Candidatus Pacearchaeota archaeon]|nr:class I SAM-dependent methyltransferase [Candidatus Pacearchaeota archaeon]
MNERKLYKKYHPGKHWENHQTIYAESFLKFLKQKNFSGVVVDLGCGNGRDVNFFSKNGLNVKGIDLDEEEISIAKKNFPGLCFELQDIEQLTFEDDSVDAFFMINVIHYLNKEKSIREISRKLKKKGYLFIHFNLEIKDNRGNIDYSQKEDEIFDLIKNFKVIKKKIFDRVDTKPLKHTHKIMELILQKQ